MTWKEILKLSPKDRDKFTALGEEYAPEEMEEGRFEREIRRDVEDTLRHKEEYKALKEKIEENKDKILQDKNAIYKKTLDYLRFMKNSIGTRMYDAYYSKLRNLLKDYDFFPSR